VSRILIVKQQITETRGPRPPDHSCSLAILDSHFYLLRGAVPPDYTGLCAHQLLPWAASRNSYTGLYSETPATWGCFPRLLLRGPAPKETAPAPQNASASHPACRGRRLCPVLEQKPHDHFTPLIPELSVVETLEPLASSSAATTSRPKNADRCKGEDSLFPPYASMSAPASRSFRNSGVRPSSATPRSGAVQISGASTRVAGSIFLRSSGRLSEKLCALHTYLKSSVDVDAHGQLSPSTERLFRNTCFVL